MFSIGTSFPVNGEFGGLLFAMFVTLIFYVPTVVATGGYMRYRLYVRDFSIRAKEQELKKLIAPWKKDIPIESTG